MPFQVQDITQGLACVGQLTLQRPHLLWGAFMVADHVAFQCVEQELNAFLDAVQLCQGLLLFVQFFVLKRGSLSRWWRSDVQNLCSNLAS